MNMNDTEIPMDPDEDGASEEEDDGIIELTDRVTDSVTEEDQGLVLLEDQDEVNLVDGMLADTVKLEADIDEGIDEAAGDDDDFLENLGMDLEEDLEAPEPLAVEPDVDPEEEPETIGLSSEQLEDALEKVIRAVYSEKIEQMLVTIVEKTVKEEIERLNVLIEDASRKD